MRIRKHHNIRTDFESKKSKIITSARADSMNTENSLYEKKMCINCIHWNQGCQKQRVPIMCAKKGLMNK